MTRLLLVLNLLVALAIGVAWLVLPAPDTRGHTPDLTSDEVRAIEQHISERVEAEFGSDEVERMDAADCSDVFNMCFASATIDPREFIPFSRTVFDSGFDLEETTCEPVGCGATWRSDNATVVIITHPDKITEDQPVMLVGISARS